MKVRACTAFVTGANRGIGAALVKELLQAGARRVYAGVRDPGSYKAADNRIAAIALDVTRPEDVAAAAQSCPDVDLLFNNAGVNASQGIIAHGDLDAARREMEVNYLGLLRMCIAFAPILRAHGGGAIVNTLTILARISLPRSGTYSASKAAAFSATQSIRAELAGQGTLVVAVCPGVVDTDMTRASPPPKMSPEEVAAEAIAAVNAGREVVYPGNMAAAVARELAEDPASVEERFRSMLPEATGAAG